MEREHLFVVGSPRSGTTWLQLLLAQHEEVVTGKETQLFTQYVSRLQDRWADELREAEVATTNGLSRLMSEEEFMAAVKPFCDRVLEHLARDSPGARFVLEKSPEHALHAETILRLYPDAWFLHIVRDPRAVSNSFRHAASKWWPWAPSGPVATTRRWKTNIVAARGIPDLTDRFHEVRYEDLLEKRPSVLAELFSWLGLEADLDFCRSAFEACAIDKLKEGSPDDRQPWKVGQEPEGFFRAGKADSWRRDLSASSVRAIEHEAGDLMVELGYEPADGGKPRSRLTPLRVRMHDWIHALESGQRELGRRVGWRLRRLRSRT